MLQKVVLVGLLVCCQHATAYKKLDFKLITTIRHGLDLSLDYINDNVYRVNVDCVLGVAFVRGFMKSAFKNGTHIMDNTSQRLFDKCEGIIAKSKWRFRDDSKNGNNWKFQNLVEADIWTKPMNFEKKLISLPAWSANSGPLESPNSDKCLQQIINSSSSSQDVSAPCVVSTDCWNIFFRNGVGSGYYLTHKLLLLQIAKARDCWLKPTIFRRQTREICSAIMSEIINANYKTSIEEMFDLFLEQVLLCGYEGFREFIQNDWLFHILKSQRFSGCFVDHLTDELKSRIKRDVNYFEDGCNDHTTGLGVAVLGLYYIYIVNEELSSQSCNRFFTYSNQKLAVILYIPYPSPWRHSLSEVKEMKLLFPVLFYTLTALKSVKTTIDLNTAELQYLADHLTPEECRRLVAAAHFHSYDEPNALDQAERKVPKDISCIEHLHHWNSQPGEGKGQSHEALEHRLRQMGKTRLADWLGRTVFHQLGADLEKSIEEGLTDLASVIASSELPAVTIEPLVPKIENPSTYNALDYFLYSLAVMLTLTVFGLCLTLIWNRIREKIRKRFFHKSKTVMNDRRITVRNQHRHFQESSQI